MASERTAQEGLLCRLTLRDARRIAARHPRGLRVFVPAPHGWVRGSAGWGWYETLHIQTPTNELDALIRRYGGRAPYEETLRAQEGVAKGQAAKPQQEVDHEGVAAPEAQPAPAEPETTDAPEPEDPSEGPRRPAVAKPDAGQPGAGNGDSGDASGASSGPGPQGGAERPGAARADANASGEGSGSKTSTHPKGQGSPTVAAHAPPSSEAESAASTARDREGASDDGKILAACPADERRAEDKAHPHGSAVDQGDGTQEGVAPREQWGGIYGQLTDRRRISGTEKRRAATILSHLRRWLKAVDCGEDEVSPRIDGRRLCVELVSRRCSLPRARRAEQGPALALLMVDVSGSCAGVCPELLRAAEELEHLAPNRVGVVVHSNGFVQAASGVCAQWAIERNSDEGAELAHFVRQGARRANRKVGASIAFGDGHAAYEYSRLAEMGPLIWLDSYLSASTLPKLASRKRLADFPGKVKPAAWVVGVGDGEAVARALALTITDRG